MNRKLIFALPLLAIMLIGTVNAFPIEKAKVEPIAEDDIRPYNQGYVHYTAPGESTITGSGSRDFTDPLTLPANFWKEGRTIRINTYGVLFTDNMEPGNLAYRFEINDQQVLDTQGSFPLGYDLDTGYMSEIMIVCKSITDNICELETQGFFQMNEHPGNGATTYKPMSRDNYYTVNIDEEQRLEFEVYFQKNGNTIRQRIYTVETIN